MRFGTYLVKRKLARTAFHGADGWQQWLDTLTSMGGASSRYVPAKGVEYTRLTVAGVPVERWTPSEDRGDLFYLHGGMYTCPLTDAYRKVAEYIALCTHRTVYAPDYAVYPNVYPVAIDEVKAVWRALASPHTVLLGDDAGGNLATVLSMQLRDEGSVTPATLLLISPLTDATCSGESYYDNYYLDPIGGQKALGGKDIKDGMADSPLWRYAGELPPQSSRVSPLWGRLSDMPPTFVVVGGEEVWRSDGERLVKAIQAKGGRADVLVGEELWHCYPLSFAVSHEAKDAFRWLFDRI